MKDRRMKAFGLFTALSLIVCLIASGIVYDAGSSYAATSSLKWTRITIPVTDEMQLYPGSDIGPMAVSPDGATLFAAVQNESSGDWELLKSIDAAYSWQDTGLSNAMAAQAPADTGNISAVQISPNWNTDGRIFVATENRVYLSEDRGGTFADLTAVPGTVYDAPPGTDEITSIALGRDSSNKVVLVVGTADSAGWVDGGDVYVFDMGIWNAQSVGTYDVLAVGLSPSYASDSTIIAVVTDAIRTMTRTKRGTGGWGVTISDATFKDQDGLDFVSYKACIGLPSDYNAINQAGSVLTCFVGLSAEGPGPVPLGDVFRINGGWLSSSICIDLNIRGNVSSTNSSETNIWSVAVSGSTSDMVIIAGTETLDYDEPPAPHGQFLVYNSIDGGGTWAPTQADYLSGKQPTGEAQATVVMTPSIAYVGAFGNQSAVSAAVASTAAGGVFSSWNQRGLIDTVIDEITDMSPSEGYFTDGTIYITTMDTITGNSSLWRTANEGRTWERLYCSTLTVDASTGNLTCIFNLVRLAGSAVIVAQRGGRVIIPSFGDGVTFRFDPWNPSIGNTPSDITAFVAEDESTYYAGDASGVVRKWTDDSGAWTSSAGSDIPSADVVVDLILTDVDEIFAGTNNGGVYSASTADLVFAAVDPENSQPGTTGDEVHVAPDLCDENFVYVGIKGSAAAQGIWRFDLSDDEAIWEHIADGLDVTSIACSECSGSYGVLYAVSDSTRTGWRSINPTTMKGDPEFEEINNGLGVGDSVMRGLKLIPSPTMLFAVGGPSYTQLWTTSDEIVKMKLLAPEDGSVSGTILEDEAFLGRARVRLEWKEIEGANKYEVKVAFDEDMESSVDISYYDGGTVESDGLLKVVYPWLGTRYYWSVRVIDPYMSQWSDVWSFITPLGPAPSIPVLLGPQAGQENVMLKPVLQWNSSVAATGYELMLAANCDFADPLLNLSGEGVISDTAYQLTFALAKNTSYCWKVRGVNEITHSPWSDTGTFTTGFTEQAEDTGLPMWVWVIIVLGAVLMLSILVLVVRSRGD